MVSRARSAKRDKNGLAGDVAGDTRARLLKAAAEVFAEAGYHEAKIRQICGRAGANIALINYHFGDKMGLYTEVLRQSFSTQHVEAMRGALDEGGPPEEIFRAVIRARIQGIANRDLADRKSRIIIHELAQPTPAMRRLIDNMTRPIYERMLELVGGMIGRAAHDERTRLCTHSVIGQIMVYALANPMLQRLWPELKMTPGQLDRIANHIADFSLAYLRDARREQERARGRRNGSSGRKRNARAAGTGQ